MLLTIYKSHLHKTSVFWAEQALFLHESRELTWHKPTRAVKHNSHFWGRDCASPHNWLALLCLRNFLIRVCLRKLHCFGSRRVKAHPWHQSAQHKIALCTTKIRIDFGSDWKKWLKGSPVIRYSSKGQLQYCQSSKVKKNPYVHRNIEKS
jgi:hypothetical protein